jgi:hypothetical protein
LRAYLVPVLFLALAVGCGDDAAVDDLSAPAVHDLSVADTAMFICDPVTQNCPSNQRCTYVGGFTKQNLTCVAPTGTLPEGAACGASSDGGVAGGDDCDKGLWCLVRDEGSVCKKFCNDSSGCTTGALPFCNASFICNHGCTLYGSECTNNTSCTAFASAWNGENVLVCVRSGSKAAGDACVASAECGPNLTCQGSPKQCRPVCDGGAHPCATGVCTGLMGGVNVNPLGYCM